MYTAVPNNVKIANIDPQPSAQRQPNPWTQGPGAAASEIISKLAHYSQEDRAKIIRSAAHGLGLGDCLASPKPEPEEPGTSAKETGKSAKKRPSARATAAERRQIILAACVGPDTKTKRLQAATARILGVSKYAIKKAIETRARLDAEAEADETEVPA